MRTGRWIGGCVALVAFTYVLMAAGDAFALDLPRFVRLSIMLEPDWTATVSWETNGEVPGEIQYGLTPAYGTSEDAFPAMPGPSGWSHFAIAQGLDPATTYHYRVGNAADGYSADFTFTTASDSQCEPVRFVAVGESRASVSGASADWDNVLGQAAGEGPGFILHAGDLVANGAFLPQWTDFFDKSGAVIPFIPIMSAIGPTDVAIDIGDDALYNRFFAFPRNDYTDTEDFYSFDYGPVHVAVVSTETFNEQNYTDQAMWLDDDLSWTDRIWKVVLLNRPPYSSGAFGSDDGKIIPYLTDVFEKYGVDLVIGAHDRDYERFKPIKNGQELASYDGATLHVVTGGGGAPVDPLFPSRPKLPESVVTDNKNHYVVFSVNGTSLHLKAVRVPGGFHGGTGVIDELEIQKTVLPDPCFVEVDAGVPDAGHDAGFDAGFADASVDAPVLDAGLDAAESDAGNDVEPVDGGVADAGGGDAAGDAAGVDDGGNGDTGVGDAGADASFDEDSADAVSADAGDRPDVAKADGAENDVGNPKDVQITGDQGSGAGEGGEDNEDRTAPAGGCSCAQVES